MNPSRFEAITALGAKSFSALARDLLPKLSNAPITIGDVTFSGLRDKLAASAANFASLDRDFPTIERAWHSAGFNPNAALGEQGLRNALHATQSASGFSRSFDLIDPYGPEATIIANSTIAGACVIFLGITCYLNRSCFFASGSSGNQEPSDVEMGAIAGQRSCPPQYHPVVMPDNQLMVATPDLKQANAAAVQAAALTSAAASSSNN